MKTLKHLLVSLLALQIFIGSWLTLVALSQSVWLSLLCLLVVLLQTALTYAVIVNFNELEKVWLEIERLRRSIRELQKNVDTDDEIVYPAENTAELAKNTWECIKCGTVNKADITHCDHCGAAYLSTVYPTDDPSVKRKKSRWIKEKRK